MYLKLGHINTLNKKKSFHFMQYEMFKMCSWVLKHCKIFKFRMTVQNAYIEKQAPPPPISFIFSSAVIKMKLIYNSYIFECLLKYMFLHLWKKKYIHIFLQLEFMVFNTSPHGRQKELVLRLLLLVFNFYC